MAVGNKQHLKLCKPCPNFCHTAVRYSAANLRLNKMKRSLFSLACCLLIAVVPPAFASPQTDADYIAAHFVEADDFKTTLRDMGVKAYATTLATALSTRSVKIKDHDGFIALLPASFSDELFDRLQKTVSDRLVQSWEPAQLESAADYLRQRPPESPVVRSDANAGLGNKVFTIVEFKQEISGLQKDDTFKDEIALTAIGVMLISLMVQETSKIDIDLKAPYLADMLEVDGVFSFPNRIVRNDLIRELRSANP